MKSFKKFLRKWLGIEMASDSKKEPIYKINPIVMSRSMRETEPIPFERYEPPAGVIPDNIKTAVMAMDATPYDYINQSTITNYFPGYPILAMLSQLPEYRKITTELAKAMTRKWVTIVASGDDDKSDKIALIESAIKKYNLQALFKDAAEHDGFFGRGQLYIDMLTPKGGSANDDPDELNSPLFMSEAKITKGSLKGFRLVEAVWTYPSAYNATDPLKADYYKPTSWYVMGKTVHASRMLMFISRPVPDLLKAAYSFGGLSMTQIAQPYVQNWIRTRDSISDLVHSFSISGIKTNLQATLSGSGDTDIFDRADLFNRIRDNRGLMLLDNDTEEFFQFNTPLSGLDALQAQSQEQMAAVSNTPLIVLLGVTPTGLNASSEGEIRVWNDYVIGMQEAIFTPNLKRALDVIQLSEFGEIDPDITFIFNSLEEMNDEEKAVIRKTDADTSAVYINAGILDADEVRQKLANDPDSGFNNIDLEIDTENDLANEDE